MKVAMDTNRSSDRTSHITRDSEVKLSPEGRKRGRTKGSTCCLIICVATLLLILIAVGIFLIVYFTRQPPDAEKPAEAEVELDGVGRLRGRLVEAPGGGQVEQYLGIPYAKPPVGALRYADPEPYGSFPDDVFEAYEYGNTCLQILDTTFGDFIGSQMWNPQSALSEDCLNLNVWVPHPRGKKRPVMVWIYGGGFYSGSSSLVLNDGKTLASQNDVIVASMNYRLGSFGFLTTSDGRIKGNFGLKDQTFALKWVRDNIEAFGGDRELVTIFGESAGSVSVSYHVLLAESAPYFRRAILQSGVVTAPWGVLTPDQARSRSQIFFDRMDCPDDGAILDCLRQKDAKDLLQNQWGSEGFLTVGWGPTVDGDYISDMPSNLLDDGKFNQVDVIMGVNKDEGTYFLLYGLPGFSKDNSSLQTYQRYLDGVNIIAYDLDKPTQQELQQLYKPDDISDGAALRDALDDVAGDRSFICPVTDWSERHRQAGGKNYYYYLSHRASNEPWPPWMGVIHGSDLQWVFGIPLDDKWKYTEEEKDFSKKVMAYWANFAKYGNPNGDDLPPWPQNSLREPSYIEFKNPSEFPIHRNSSHREEICQTWNRIQQANVETAGLNGQG